jgi:hypothetical protein
VGPDSALRVLEDLYLLVFAFGCLYLHQSTLHACRLRRIFNRHRYLLKEHIPAPAPTRED